MPYFNIEKSLLGCINIIEKKAMDVIASLCRPEGYIYIHMNIFMLDFTTEIFIILLRLFFIRLD